MIIRFMSYNVCSGRNFNNGKKINILDAGDVIKKYDPDIIGLNEVRGFGNIAADYTEQVKTLGEKLGYHYYFSKAIEFEEGPYGNGLLSKFPILKKETILIPDPIIKNEDSYYETRCVIKSKIKISQHRDINLYISHFGLANSEKLNAVKTISALIEKEKKEVVFMGDLNMEPEDIKLRPVYDLMTDTMVPEKRKEYLSFPSWKPEIKIDYIFISSDLKSIRSFVPDETTSDHRPYIADINI